MSGFVECVNHYYTEYDYNCSETIVHAANEYYGLGITEDDMRMFAGFGGGMFSGLVCGALAASVAVLSKIAVKDKAGKAGRAVRPIISDLVRTFRKELNGVDCAELKAQHFNKEDHCLETVLLSAKVLEGCIDKVKKGMA